MKKFNALILSLMLSAFINFFLCDLCFAQILTGNIDKEAFLEKSRTVVDGATGNPIAGAEVSISNERITTKTDSMGQFRLDASVKSPFVLSVKADGYKPFSITINENKTNNPLTIAISKLFGNELVIDSDLHHLGDDNFSEKSENAEDFKLQAEGSGFTKDFFIGKLDSKANPVLKIGTIIGVDTNLAHRLDAKMRIKAYSSPLKVYINSKKVGSIKINGDNQEISLPKNILKQNSNNTIEIKTGTNQQVLSYTDYDDMEFMNLLLAF